MTLGEIGPETGTESPPPMSVPGRPCGDAVSTAPQSQADPHAIPAVLAVVALVASALVGGNLFGVRDRLFGSATPKAAIPAVSRDASTPSPNSAAGTAPTAAVSGETTVPPAATVLRSEPWWQNVTTRQGSGSMKVPAFNIDGGAIQWRAQWTCQVGHLTVRTPTRSRAVVDSSCPGMGTGYSTEVGAQSLDVTADGPWQLRVEQQVDVPLVEAPLSSMTAPGARVVFTGSFYNIDQSGSGRVTIYQLAANAYALRLDNFFVSPNIDLEIRLSPLASPHSTDQFTSSTPSDTIAPLDITAGSLNFTVPSAIDPTHYRSVVIWCPLIHSAYAAATLVAAE